MADPGPQAPGRRRIAGTTTDRLNVRACAGPDVGRPAQARVHQPAGRRAAARRHEAAEIEPSALQLTRRGRAVLTAFSILVFGAAVAVLGLRVAGVLEPEQQFTRTVQVEVGAGDTLWSIARSTNPGGDPAAVVEQIADLNDLRTAADVIPGRIIEVPVR
ncbi:LysM peptidoglycan-binding domain-containing protein [Kribbella flavida]|uniref:LysM peptidoglycan-binding domain-containing protein n=1 Tax=Kribbella flavida TaxID=182640 RepID=UPI00019BECC0|nr:LysM peptidoglycan-binding domain-containing protein [Kribbella flavida]